MEIAFVTHYADLYGANRSLLNLIIPLRNSGIEPFVIMPFHGQLSDELKEHDIEFLIEPYRIWMGEYVEEGGFIKRIINKRKFRKKGEKILEGNKTALENIFNKIKKQNVRLIYSNSSVINIGFELARKMSIPHIWHIREFGDKDYNHFPYIGRSTFLKIIKQSEYIIFNSKVVRKYFNCEENIRSSVVYNGVLSMQESLALDTEYQQQDEVVFVIIGFIMDNKGQADALNAFIRINLKYPLTRLIISGSGEQQEIDRLKALIEKNNLQSKVELTGYVNDPFIIYKKANAILMCSKNEAMGRVTVEAFLSGRPVIGLNSGATPELINHMYNGLLYENENDGLYEAMKWFVLNKEKSIQLGKNAREEALSKFTSEIYADQIAVIINKVLKMNKM